LLKDRFIEKLALLFIDFTLFIFLLIFSDDCVEVLMLILLDGEDFSFF